MSLLEADVWNVGTCALMGTEKLKRKNRESASREAEHRGGPVRSSGEASVTDVERRGRIVLPMN